MQKERGGFTLVELMVVAIIVAILAAVAIPLMTGNKKRAAATEAEAGLGMIRSAMRAMYAQTGAYNTNLNGVAIVAGTSFHTNGIAGVQGNDLDGRYFSGEAYTLDAVAGSSYRVKAVGDSPNIASNKTDVAGITITLDESGNFSRTGM